MKRWRRLAAARSDVNGAFDSGDALSQRDPGFRDRLAPGRRLPARNVRYPPQTRAASSVKAHWDVDLAGRADRPGRSISGRRRSLEEALGADAEGVLPEAVRLIDLHVRLPRYQVAMLEYLAGRERGSVGGVLARELDGLASAHADELSWAVAGFADALAWPDPDAAPPP